LLTRFGKLKEEEEALKLASEVENVYRDKSIPNNNKGHKRRGYYTTSNPY